MRRIPFSEPPTVPLWVVLQVTFGTQVQQAPHRHVDEGERQPVCGRLDLTHRHQSESRAWCGSAKKASPCSLKPNVPPEASGCTDGGSSRSASEEPAGSRIPW